MLPTRRVRCIVAVMTAVVIAGAGCGVVIPPPKIYEPSASLVEHAKDPLKAHMKSGELVVLESWRKAADGTQIDGTGTRYSIHREALESGPLSIVMADVALFETSASEEVVSGGGSVLALLTVVLGGATAVCVASPKSCFGSCPTFYLDNDDEVPVAEGFSSSIAKALEARDVDAIFGGRDTSERRLRLTMRNEALETHAVRRVRLLVARRPARGRILAGPAGTYHAAYDLAPPLSCTSAEGDCREQVAGWDQVERSSEADRTDLAMREEIELVFPPAEGSLGIVVGARQSLMSTFLFYQTMAHFGSKAGEFLAAVERGGAATQQALAMARVLGGIEVSIEVSIEDREAWMRVGEYDEAGPIAPDVRVFPFHASGSGPVRVRLRLTKGHWRLGYVALARLGGTVTPDIVEATSVSRGDRLDTEAEGIWRTGKSHVITQPGDTLRMEFALPHAARDLELFLESEGFYYEWMRQEWISEEDPEMALLSITNPHEALRRLAGPFEKHEASLDEAFWASRFRGVR